METYINKKNLPWLLAAVLAAILLVVLFADNSVSPGGVKVEEEEATQQPTAQNPSTTTQPPITNTVKKATESTTKRATVNYTSAGFSPFLLEITAGNTVDFVNNSNGTLWVTAQLHPTARDQHYPEFDAGKSIAPGKTFSFVFTRIGSWGYKNLNNEKHLGTIVVIPQ